MRRSACRLRKIKDQVCNPSRRKEYVSDLVDLQDPYCYLDDFMEALVRPSAGQNETYSGLNLVNPISETPRDHVRLDFCSSISI